MSSAGASIAMGRVLLICNDTAVIEHLSESMHQLAIATEVCMHAEMALGLMNLKKFEGVIVDLGLDKADQILEQLRLSPSNRTAVTFAIADPGEMVGLGVQPNFLIEKPISPASVGRTLKAAFGMIVRERRRSFRCPVDLPAAIEADGQRSDCTLVNISEGGMAITRSPFLKPGAKVRTLFMLPGETVRFKIEAEVCWYDDKGRGGLRSLLIPSEQKSILQVWLAAKLEEDLPESVARQFRNE
jgi:CheY-like chemotaxis protein